MKLVELSNLERVEELRVENAGLKNK